MNEGKYALQITTPQDFMKRAAGWIRSARLQKRWTQAFLASRAGVATSTLAFFERSGEGSLRLVSRLLFALGLLDALDAFVKNQADLTAIPPNLSVLLDESEPRRPMRIRRRRTEEVPR